MCATFKGNAQIFWPLQRTPLSPEALQAAKVGQNRIKGLWIWVVFYGIGRYEWLQIPNPLTVSGIAPDDPVEGRKSLRFYIEGWAVKLFVSLFQAANGEGSGFNSEIIEMPVLCQDPWAISLYGHHLLKSDTTLARYIDPRLNRDDHASLQFDGFLRG